MQTKPQHNIIWLKLVFKRPGKPVCPPSCFRRLFNADFETETDFILKQVIVENLYLDLEDPGKWGRKIESPTHKEPTGCISMVGTIITLVA